MSLSVPRLRIGSTEIIALADGEGPFFSPRAEAFPGATAAQWAEVDRYDPGAVNALDALNPQLRETLTDPLEAAGRLRLLDGDTPLRAGRTVATPGHQSVLVADGRELALVTGDLLVHALQLLHPELAYSHEIDPEAARHSRERMLGRDTATTLHLATPHLTEPFISA
ncbi:hypothetical protein AB0B56_34950 [Streptosporangium canum]|uniref:hypothetical protein n=1 Tax=Streptosporangium canum TaxID=324952 RepID=UPI00342D03F8